MEGQEYLNQISAENRPVKKSGGKIFSSKFFWVGVIGVVALIIIMIIGALLGGNKGGEKNLTYALKLHLDNTAAIISEYQPTVKSSALRSSSASFYGVLTNTSRDLTNYLTERYNFKDKDISQNLTDEAQLNSDGLKAELFEAKINGVLDRVYAHKMAYEIMMIKSEESKIYDSTSNETLKEMMSQSFNSLENLYDNFNDFSETK